jgi:hypothetical protein
LHGTAADPPRSNMAYDVFARKGLILRDTVGPFVTQRDLTRDVSAGLLIRLRRGAYVEAAAWAQLTAQQRHILRIQSVVALAAQPVIVCGMSAAALWGMPVKESWPDYVTVLEHRQGGGRSDPGIKRSSAGVSTARTVTIRGVRVTDLARTTLDIARVQPFTDAIGSVDWALTPRNPNAITAHELASELRRLNPRVGGAHLQRLINFASPLSGSFYESAARAAMHLLGFAPPELQVVFTDAQGEMIPDFFWRTVRVAGEFDGKVKFTRHEYTKGNPSEVAWAEKKREDRLRNLKLGVVRILTEHVENPGDLERLLVAAGVPRIG